MAPRKKRPLATGGAMDEAARAARALIAHIHQWGVVLEVPSLKEWGQFIRGGKRLPFGLKPGPRTR
jgi:hypothetical protein